MSIFCCPQPLQRYFDIIIFTKYPIKAIYWIFSSGNMFTILSIFKNLLVEHNRGTIIHPGSPSRGYKPQTKIFSQETAHLQKGRCFSQGSLYSLLSCELGQHLNEDVESNWGWQMMGQISTGGLNVVWYARVEYCSIVWFGMLNWALYDEFTVWYTRGVQAA